MFHYKWIDDSRNELYLFNQKILNNRCYYLTFGIKNYFNILINELYLILNSLYDYDYKVIYLESRSNHTINLTEYELNFIKGGDE